ncbi:MAG: hypothetical protein AAGN66_01495 [Acidobacteriota bacterium]
MGLLGAFVPAIALAQPPFQLHGWVAARGLAVEGRPSWRDGDFGRLDVGADDPEDDATYGAGKLQLALDARLGQHLDAHLHFAARAEPEGTGGRAFGLVEGYLEAHTRLRDSDRVSLRAGHLILPTSKENLDWAWSSPYTLTFSALNTWIGEEVRATGLLGAYQLAFGEADELRFWGSAFGGNDSGGTLLAWRGWALGDRLGVWNETVPLPPLPGLETGAPFGEQLDSGTRPFGSDLDDRAGWAASLGWRRAGRASLQATHYDNRGDRELYNGEYAWRTDFYLVGGDLHLPALGGELSLVAEWMDGSTGMGELDSTHVQLDFETTYYLVSWSRGLWRLTTRYDHFETRDTDGSVPLDPNDGDGSAWTVAAFWEHGTWPLRLGAEWVDVDAVRPAAGLVGTGALPSGSDAFGPDTGGQSLILEARVFLDR